MSEFSGHQKICATCVYWIAQRDTDFSNSRVKDCANEGRCAIPQGSYRHMRRIAFACACSDYQKWPVLR